MVTILLSGCGTDKVVRDPVAEVRRAARATLSEPSNLMTVRVSSPKAEYRVRGRIEFGADRDRYRGTTSFARGGRRAFPARRFHIVGSMGAVYIGEPDLAGSHGRPCWFRPHLPIGSAPGTVSTEEALILVGTATRLLAGAIDRARVVDDATSAGARYEAWVDRSAAKRISPSDDAAKLARAIDRPIAVETVRGHLGTISLELPRFRSEAYIARFRGVDSADIQVSFTPAQRTLKLHPPGCLAIE